jgi:hypothetical protein
VTEPEGYFPRLTRAEAGAYMISIIATPVGTEHVMPLRKACGRYVDWYTTPAQSPAP